MSEEVISHIENKMRRKVKKNSLMDILKLVSPGTVLRTAIDDILRAGMGALIVIDSPILKRILEGGFKVESELTPQKIVELAKMDGAIILSSDLSQIISANVLLFPSITIQTKETGTRHKAAERTAKQANTLVIAVSEKRKKITVYYGTMKYILKNTEELLSRATETLQILEKQREIFNELLSNLNVLEISGLVVISDVCSVLQRAEMIMRIAKMIERYLIELGREGRIIKMRLRELLKNIEREREFILKDYDSGNSLEEFSFDDLLEIENISHLLFSSETEEKVKPKGFRILGKMDLDKKTVNKLIERFENLNSILITEDDKMKKVLGAGAEHFQKELSSLKEQIMMAKKI